LSSAGLNLTIGYADGIFDYIVESLKNPR